MVNYDERSSLGWPKNLYRKYLLPGSELVIEDGGREKSVNGLDEPAEELSLFKSPSRRSRRCCCCCCCCCCSDDDDMEVRLCGTKEDVHPMGRS